MQDVRVRSVIATGPTDAETGALYEEKGSELYLPAED